MDKKKYESLPASAFEFVPEEGRMHDKKLESKPIGYFRDAFNRFCRNKSSVVAAFIIMILFLFAVFVPIFCENSYTRALTDTDYLNYTKLLPKSKLLGWLGVDGTKVEKDVNSSNYLKYQALYEETGYKAVVEVIGEPRVDKTQQADYEKRIQTLEKQIADAKSPAVKKQLQKKLDAEKLATPSKFYDLRIDTYHLGGKYGMHNLDLTYAQFKRIQNWQNDHPGIQVIYPVVDEANADSNIWFVHESGTPVLDENGNIQDNYVRKSVGAAPWDKSATVKAYGADVMVDVKFNLNGTVNSLKVSIAGETSDVMDLYTAEEFTSQFIGKAAPFTLLDPAAEAVAEGSVIECVEGTYADGKLADVSSLRTAETIVKVLNDKAATLEKAPFVRSQDIKVADLVGKVNLTFNEEGVITEFQVELPDDGTEVVKYYLSEEFANQFIGKSGRFTTSGQTKTAIGDGKEVVIQTAPIAGVSANKLEIDNVFDVIHNANDFVEATANTKLCNSIVNAVTNQTPKGFEFSETATAFETFVTVNATFDEKGYVTAFTMDVDGETATMTSEEATAAFADQVIGKRAPFVQVKTEAEKEKVNSLDSTIDVVSGATMTGNAVVKALHNAAPDYTSVRIGKDEGDFVYAKVGGSETSKSYNVRINLYNYFQYKYGFEPSFFFGTNTKGQDILTRLASGARFSFILAIGVSSINMLIGAIYGAIQGYYGGTVDLVMDRVSDVLNNVPFMVVTALFQLHLANKVGPVVALIFAFVLTGWIGMAARVRMQFYRFKGQEYILAARTLGAKDSRLMFKHIFPNSLGTIITGSVLVIPGMIFSESSMTYLGIVNLESSTMTSVGTMLANGKDQLQTNPHIILFPALYVSLLMISFNLFGNGLRDAFNPSLRGAE